MRSSVGTDAALRREGAEQHVVEAVILAGALERLDVERLLDDADAAPVAPRVGADRGTDRRR